MKIKSDCRTRDPFGDEVFLYEMGVDEYENLGIHNDIAGLGRFYVDRVVVGDEVMIVKSSVDETDNMPSPQFFRFHNIKKRVGLFGLQNRTDPEGGLPCRA